MMAACLMVLGRVENIPRPAIACDVPSLGKKITLLDCGANADARAEHLLQFAHMGSIFAEEILGGGPETLGLLLSAPAIGAAAAPVSPGRVRSASPASAAMRRPSTGGRSRRISGQSRVTPNWSLRRTLAGIAFVPSSLVLGATTFSVGGRPSTAAEEHRAHELPERDAEGAVRAAGAMQLERTLLRAPSMAMIRLMPANSGAATEARKWSPPPVRSVTSASPVASVRGGRGTGRRRHI